MEEPTQLIPEITLETTNWAVRITVIEDIPIMTCSNGSKLKRYIFADKEGNEVVATVYGRDVPLLCPMIHLHEVYDIANAEVRSVPKNFQILDSPLLWNIKRQTPIRPVPHAAPTLHNFLHNLTPFNLILANDVNSKTADVMGILIAADEIKEVNNGQNTVQHFTIIDKSKMQLSISVWDEVLASLSRVLIAATNNNSVIVAKRLSIKTYNCVSLSSKNSSSFTINPPLEVANNLRAWYNALPDTEKQEMLNNRTVDDTREFVMSGKMRTYSIIEVTNQAQAGDYWVRGYLKLAEENQRFYYVACPICQNKIRKDPGVTYLCFICRVEVIASLRLLVVLSAFDDTTITKVIAVDQVAEQLLQTTPEHMLDLVKQGQNLEIGTLKTSIENKNYLMLLRRNFGRNLDAQRRLLLISLEEKSTTTPKSLPNIDSDSTTSDTSPSGSSIKGKQPECQLSPLKRQMSQIEITTGGAPKKQLFSHNSGKPKHLRSDSASSDDN